MKLEIVYNFNGVMYNVCEAQEVHTKLQNDNHFAEIYFQNANLEIVGVDNSNNSNTELLESFQWDRKTTKLLLQEYTQQKENFRNPKMRKRTVWNEILQAFLKNGYRSVTIDILDTKFRNLKKTYKSILDNNKKTKTGKGIVSWEHFGDMDEIFMDDKTINVGHTISSLQSQPSCSQQIQPVNKSLNKSPSKVCHESYNTNIGECSTSAVTNHSQVQNHMNDNRTSPLPCCNSDSTETSSSASAPPKKSRRTKKLNDSLARKQVELEETRLKLIERLCDTISESNKIQHTKVELMELLVKEKK